MPRPKALGLASLLAPVPPPPLSPMPRVWVAIPLCSPLDIGGLPFAGDQAHLFRRRSDRWFGGSEGASPFLESNSNRPGRCGCRGTRFGEAASLELFLWVPLSVCVRPREVQWSAADCEAQALPGHQISARTGAAPNTCNGGPRIPHTPAPTMCAAERGPRRMPAPVTRGVGRSQEGGLCAGAHPGDG